MARIWSIRYDGERALIAARRGRAGEARRLVTEAEVEVATLEEILASFPPPGVQKVTPSSMGDLLLPVGEVAFWLGDTARAIRALSTRFVKLPRHNLLLGQAYEREQNLAEARAACTRVVESTNLSIKLAWARPIAQEKLAAIGR